MQTVFRVDASEEVGLGHFMRCLALAGRLREQGSNIFFISHINDEKLKKLLLNNGYSYYPLENKKNAESAIVNDLIENIKPDVVVLDGYKFDYAYQTTLNIGHSLLVCMSWEREFDTLADIIVNQNLWADPNLYKDRIPSGAKLLLGTKYALLGGSFDKKAKIESKVRNVLLTFGGGSNYKFGCELYQKISDLPYNFLLTVGDHYCQHEGYSSEGNLSIIKGSYDLKPYMADSDLAISAGGTTCWELCYTGLPFITIILSENQRPNAESLHTYEAAYNVGYYQEDRVAYYKEIITSLANDYELRLKMGSKGKELVDGLGAKRVAKEIIKAVNRKRN